ncbi:MAG: hypothetical protein D6B25_04825 [Desulfobulbaceae bacterium]|nr:MAG: hypothetical protein D6B25_04825 [Desulfobulbaceae bacterium]
MKRYFSLSAIIVVMFMIILSTPLAISLFTQDLEVSKSEKRKLVQFPELSFTVDGIKTFPGTFEKYYKDHFGLRSQIVRLHNYTLCKLFKVSPTGMVIVGSDNWYFFNANGSLGDYLGRFHFTDNRLKDFESILLNRDAWLKKMGTHYIFLPIPNKETVYEEYLPRRIRKHKGVNKYTQVIEYLRSSGQFTNFIDTEALLLHLKQEQQVYLKTDSHWNNDGAFGVYQELINQLSKKLPNLQPLKQTSEKEWIEDFSGDLAIFMNLRGLVTETAPAINVERECKPSGMRRMTELKETAAYKDVEPHRLPVTNGCKKKEYSAIVIHDSFGNFLRKYLSQNFRKIIYIHHMNFEDAKVLIAKEQPDVVIDLRVARNLEKALMPDPELEQMIANQAENR